MRRTGLILTAAATCLGLAACSSEEPAPIAEPAVSFPTTKSVPKSTASTTTKKKDDKKKDEKKKDEKKTTKKTTAKKTTSQKKPANSGSSGGGNSAPEPAAPAPAAAAGAGEKVVLTQCTWPKESDAKNGEEFQRFCDGKWAETSFPGEGDFVWKADGPKWVSIEAKKGENGDLCYDPKELEGAPDVLRNRLPVCNGPVSDNATPQRTTDAPEESEALEETTAEDAETDETTTAEEDV